MAFGDRIKDWWGSWGDDDTVYEDESSFDDDLWADLGIDPDSDPDTWFDDPVTPTDDPYGIGSFFDDTYNFGDWDWGGDDDSWDPPTGTVNPWEDEAGLWDSDTGGLLRDLFGAKEDDPYGIGSYFDTYDYGLPKSPTVDFEDPDFNWGEFDVDSYLDSILDPGWGGGTEGDPSSWFINSGDPYNIGETYTKGSDEWDQIMAELSDYDPNIASGTSGYAGGGAGSPYDEFDSLATELGYDPSTGSVEDWLQSYLPTTKATDPMQEMVDYLTNAGLDPSTYLFSDTPGAGDTGMFGGKVGPWLRNLFLGSGGTGTGTGTGTGEGIGGLLGWLMKGRQGQTGSGGGGLFGGSGLETLLKLAAINQLRKQDSDDPADVVPIGADAFSAVGQGGEGSPIDYRVFNLQPALMPGVAYANVGKPEGMKGGGLGDVTLAKLEPGEFVVTKKAVDNIGAKNLYKMMKQAEGMG
jgi:hypothetical protein